MKIRNINGTTQNKCNCESWLDHWKKYSGHKNLGYCPVPGCYESDLVGAHVQMDNSNDNNWYIIPLCKKHNAATGQSFEVNNTYNLVSANISQTCG